MLREELMLMVAPGERPLHGFRHSAGTCHLLPPRSQGDREEVLLAGHAVPGLMAPMGSHLPGQGPGAAEGTRAPRCLG